MEIDIEKRKIVEKKIAKKKNIYAVLAGVFAGLINGVFGGGGGMIIVPMLIMLLKFEPKNAHATAILIILPLSLVSTLFYVAFGAFNVTVGLPVGAGVVFGGLAGAFLLNKLSAKWLVVIFSIVMLFAGIKMLIF